MCASMADGDSFISGANTGADVGATINALRSLGVAIDGDYLSAHRVHGTQALRDPESVLDCGNSGSTMRMLAGLIAGRVDATLDGDASLRRRPMERVAAPLRAMGADVRTTEGRAPIIVRASGQVHGEAVNWKVASAQVKSAVLLAAVRAQGPTVITEPAKTRDHTERMLRAMGANLEVRGLAVVVQPSSLKPLVGYRVPGDLSAAFFFLAGGAVVRGSHISMQNVGLNPTRTAALDALRGMGADIKIDGIHENYGEPVGDIVVRGGSQLRSVAIDPAKVPNLIDEVPALCALAAAARVDFEINGAAELRTKESDRIATTVRLLQAFGAHTEELKDGIKIRGGSRLTAPKIVDTEGDHRIGMSAAILALATNSPITIDDADCIATSFPGFADAWHAAF